MNYKDNMGKEIKNIMEEETKNMKLSSKTMENIMATRQVGIVEKINNFLNREIQIPLAPALLGFILILGITTFPKGLPTAKEVETIEINGSQLIIRSGREVGRRWK